MTQPGTINGGAGLRAIGRLFRVHGGIFDIPQLSKIRKERGCRHWGEGKKDQDQGWARPHALSGSQRCVQKIGHGFAALVAFISWASPSVVDVQFLFRFSHVAHSEMRKTAKQARGEPFRG